MMTPLPLVTAQNRSYLLSLICRAATTGSGFLSLSLGLLAANINPDQYLAHIRYLASPELKGRATGSPELKKPLAISKVSFFPSA